MPIDPTPSKVATSALQAIPFGSLIGAPLGACIQAQAMAARTTCEFINDVGFDAAGKAKNVIFEYQKDGKIATLVVPILSIVPIPYIQVDSLFIDFMANISAASSSVTENSESTSKGAEVGVTGKVGWGPFSMNADFKANYSSKKDSKATQESKYSVEYTMSVHLGASQSHMPTGLASILNILQASITGSAPGGELTVSPKASTIATPSQAAYFEFTVQDSHGILVPKQNVKITLSPAPEALTLKSLAIGPGELVGEATATAATATTDDSGVVGVTVEIGGSSGTNDLIILKLGGTAAILTADGKPGATKTATAQLTILPQKKTS
jgi:hypothetical protein